MHSTRCGVFEASPKAATTNSTQFKMGNRVFETSNGYPVYAQGHNAKTGQRESWADGHIPGSKVSAIGCAMTSVTMAVNGISGKTISPGQMNDFMNKIGGYAKGGGIQSWSRMGEIAGSGVQVRRSTSNIDANAIDKELAAGRPVVVQVDSHKGHGKSASAGHDGVGDHWILITGRTPDGHYSVNDPAGGNVISMHRRADGKLEGDSDKNQHHTTYVTTGNAALFNKGPAQATSGSTPAVTPQAPQAASTPASRPSQTPTPATRAASTPTKAGGVALKPASPEVKSAIRAASDKVGVDYGYMMAMAAQESSFDPKVPAKKSSAVGLYQFLNQTWLGEVKNNGARHGMGEYASHIRQENGKYVVDDPSMKQKILNLRTDPEKSAMLGAEFAKDNQTSLQKTLNRQVGPTDLYMAHFLGPSAAAQFLRARDSGQGAESAVSHFPKAARSNPGIFYTDKTHRTPRSLDQVYAVLNSKIAPPSEAYARVR